MLLVSFVFSLLSKILFKTFFLFTILHKASPKAAEVINNQKRLSSFYLLGGAKRVVSLEARF